MTLGGSARLLIAGNDPRLYRAWAAQGPAWFGWSGSLILIGWSVFAATQSPVLVSVAFVLRLLPLVLAGVPAGAASDRIGRARALMIANLVAAALTLTLVVVPTTPVPGLLLLSGALGLTDALRMVAGANLVFELAGTFTSTRALAVSMFIAALGQALGSLVTGPLLGVAGTSTAAIVVGAAFAVGGVLLISLHPHGVTLPPARHLIGDIKAGLGLVRRSPQVAILLTVAIIVELFGFSGIALDPVFAGSVFVAGPAGLGLLGASRAFGRLIGSGSVVIRGRRLRIGVTLASSAVAFGIALIAFAAAPSLEWALPFALIAGLSGAVIDVLEQTGLQESVRASERGRATGLWVISVGLGPVGVIAAGSLAEVLGARLTQAVYGLIVAVVGVLLLSVWAATLRRLDRASPSIKDGAEAGEEA